MTLVRASEGVAVVACSTCRRAETPRSARADGAAFVDALSAAKASDARYADIAIEAMACLFACGDACTVHLRGPGRIGYVLGRFDGSDADARAVLDHAVHYAASAEGQVPYRDWPAGVKGHFLVRVPPAGDGGGVTAYASPAAFEAALRVLPDADLGSVAAAQARQAELTKPAGSLGRLEDVAVFIAGWQGRVIPVIDHARAIVFAGNHGVVAQDVSAYPASVTEQMVRNFERGGAAINALAGVAGLDLSVVALDLGHPTGDITQGRAMPDADCLAALNAGAASVAGAEMLVLGEMGIGNSTVAAALCAASLGGDGADWVGRGTGVDDAGLARKIAAVDAAVALHGRDLGAFATLAALGGREIAAIAGAVVAARLARVPVILDGFICTAALAPLAKANPAIVAHCLAGHRSVEPGHARLLDALGLDPLLALDMRLGEGSGAAVAMLVVRAALAAHARMATFGEAGVAQA